MNRNSRLIWRVLLLLALFLSVAPPLWIMALSQATRDPGVAWYVLRYFPLQILVWVLTALLLLCWAIIKWRDQG